MKEVVIIDGVRTPVGNHGGAFREVLSRDLGATVMRGLIERTKIDPALISEVIMGCCAMPSDAPNIARAAALLAGVPKKVPGYTINRNCDSGLEAITSPGPPAADQSPRPDTSATKPAVVFTSIASRTSCQLVQHTPKESSHD